MFINVTGINIYPEKKHKLPTKGGMRSGGKKQ